MNHYFVLIFIFFFGACVGSFLNVCIYRLPIDKSIIRPRSSCTKCNNMIKFYDNIPLLSYILLGGKCRYCKEIISLRYPIVEIISGFFALSTFIWFGLTFEALIYYIFISALIIITYIDIDYQIIPDSITLPGIPIGFLLSLLIHKISYIDSLIGILVGGGSLYSVGLIYYLLTKKEGMGGGDIKLLAMTGAVIGLKGVLFTIFTASAIGTIAGLLIMAFNNEDTKHRIPFGPFLSMGAIIYIFWGQKLIYIYINLLR